MLFDVEPPDVVLLLELGLAAGHAASMAEVRQANRDSLDAMEGEVNRLRLRDHSSLVIDAPFSIKAVGDT